MTVGFEWPRIVRNAPSQPTPIETRLRRELREYAIRRAELEAFVSRCEFLPALLDAMDCGDWMELAALLSDEAQ